MALESDRQGLRIDVQSLAPRPEAIVTPEAIAAQQAAFQTGVNQANTAFDRSRMAPVIAAQVAQATDPQLLAAQKATVLARAAQEQTQAQAGQLQLQQAQAAFNIPPIVHTMQAELAKVGLQVPVAPKDWSEKDTAEVYERWRGVEDWKTNKAAADAALEIIKPQEVESGGVKRVVPMNQKTAQPVSSQQIAQIQQWSEANKTPQLFLKNGKPSAPSIFAQVAPGQTATAGQAGGATQAGAVGADGMVVNTEAKAPTEQQMKAGNFTARALTADQVFANLEKAGYNPGSFGNWAQDLLIGPLKALQTSDKRQFDSAKNSWLQGLLRLESGAAISTKEQSWYENAFFPQVGDPPAVQQQKQQMRSDVEKIADKVAKGGQLDVGALLGVEQRAGGNGGARPAGNPAGAGQKTITVSGVGTGYLDLSDPANPRFVVTGNAGNGGASTYNPPATLKKPDTTPARPKVELKDIPEPKRRGQRIDY